MQFIPYFYIYFSLASLTHVCTNSCVPIAIAIAIPIAGFCHLYDLRTGLLLRHIDGSIQKVNHSSDNMFYIRHSKTIMQFLKECPSVNTEVKRVKNAPKDEINIPGAPF